MEADDGELFNRSLPGEGNRYDFPRAASNSNFQPSEPKVVLRLETRTDCLDWVTDDPRQTAMEFRAVVSTV